MKIRIKFTRHGAVKFLGHLDLMRYFQKAIRRAGIDIRYSEGFSPHQIMSFALPIGVGVESNGEYFDIDVHSTMSSDEAVNALNQTMAEGICVTDYVRLADDAPKAMAQVAAASYELYYKDSSDNPFDENALLENIKKYLTDAEQIIVMKQTKKSEREIDLKPFIYEFKVIDRNGPAFFMQLSAGSIENIKPQLLLNYLYEQMEMPYDLDLIQIERQDLFYKDGNDKLIPLSEAGECIE